MSTSPAKYSYTHPISARRVEEVIGASVAALKNAGFPQIDWVDGNLWADMAEHLLLADLVRLAAERGFDYPYDVTECTCDGSSASIRFEFEDELALVLFRTFVL